MSKFKKKLAEILQMDDGTYVDSETGEVFDNKPKETGNKLDDKLRNLMFEERKKAIDIYRDSKYLNQWGKVSPINIIYNDNLNDIYAMDPQGAKDAIINIIEQLNATYGNDKTYDYMSKEYVNKLKLNLSKKKTIDQIVLYLTNIYFKGIGMSMTGGLFDENDELMVDKDFIKKAVIGLNRLLK